MQPLTGALVSTTVHLAVYGNTQLLSLRYARCGVINRRGIPFSRTPFSPHKDNGQLFKGRPTMARTETVRCTAPRRTIIPPGVWTFIRGRHGSLPGPLCDWLLSRHIVTRLANKPVILDSLLSWQLSAELFGERTGEQKYDSCAVGCRNCCFVCQLFEHAHLLDPGVRTGRSQGGQEDRVGRGGGGAGTGEARNGGGGMQERGGAGRNGERRKGGG